MGGEPSKANNGLETGCLSHSERWQPPYMYNHSAPFRKDCYTNQTMINKQTHIDIDVKCMDLKGCRSSLFAFSGHCPQWLYLEP